MQNFVKPKLMLAKMKFLHNFVVQKRNPCAKKEPLCKKETLFCNAMRTKASLWFANKAVAKTSFLH